MTDSRVKLAKLSAGIREVLSSGASSDSAWTMLRCCLGKEGLGLSGIANAINEVLAEPRFIQQGTECDFCRTQALENPGSHDFRVVGDALYFFDSQFGWEGMDAAYCPKCGRKLYARKEDTP